MPLKFRCPNNHTVTENAVCPYCSELTWPVEDDKPVKQPTDLAEPKQPEKKKAD